MPERLPATDDSSLLERVYATLRLALLRGRFLPGETLSLRSLAASLGTSPMPVRAAVQRLIAERALVQTAGRAIKVAPFTYDICKELVQIRMEVEGFAAERACMSKEPGLVERLAAHNQSMIEAAQNHDVEAALAANYSFHFGVYEAAGLPQLLGIISNLWLRAGPYLAAVQRQPRAAEILSTNSYNIQGRVIEAIQTRNRKAARFSLALDIRFAFVWFLKNYDFSEDRLGGLMTHRGDGVDGLSSRS
jgi:DNA-binding GntR family transcriptional regulator